ncbi:MAG: ATP-binding protein, partial [Eubacterium sp.]
MKHFVGRKQELEYLENAYHNNNAFVMVNGRRRVGKTTLIRHFLKNKKALYFTAEEEVDLLSRKRMLRDFADYYGDDNGENNKIAQWKEIFKTFGLHVQPERKILVIDNIGYLIQSNPSFIKALKYAWEHFFKQASVMLIIIMPNDSIYVNLENKKNTLISVLTLQIKLKPISFVDLFQDYPHRDFNHLMSLYAITGGVPKYWEFFKNCENTMDHMGVIRSDMLNPAGFLFEEPANLLSWDIWEPSYYQSILKAIADGLHKPADIAKALGMKQSAVFHGVKNLVTLGYIEGKVSVTDRKTITNRRVQYYFLDPMMNFWFAFVFSHRGELENGRDLEIFENI